MKYFILFLMLALSSSLLGQRQTPNILLVIADDMGIDVTEGFGIDGDKPVTPTLDSLRTNGLAFTNCWATPQCTPTRAAIMSGKFGIKTGVMRPPGPLDTAHTSLFKRINQMSPTSYEMAVIGKWHIGGNTNLDHPAQTGVDHYEGVFNSSVDSYYDWSKVSNGSTEQIQEYATTHFTNDAIDWISEQHEPWFLWLAHIAPHGPFEVPPAGTYTTVPVDNRTTYFAMIEAMDYELGRLLSSLDEEERKNTVVIFIGDNGTPNGVSEFYPQGHAKGSVYEGGLRVPMIVSGKNITRKGEIEDGLVQVTDLHATIMELTGVQLPGGINNSLSIKPMFDCANQTLREINYSDYNDDGTLQWAARTAQYKFIEDEFGNEEFYDISVDIKEEFNLIDILSAEQQLIKESLQEEVTIIRTTWSCSDGIQNGDETTIDDCNNNCTDIDELSTENIGCCLNPAHPSVYYEFLEGDQRTIYCNTYPNHAFCHGNQIPEPSYKLYRMDLVPELSGIETSVTRDNGRPANYFGIANNGIFMMPAPALPFVFENVNTGEYNWDWVFEPTVNQGPDQGFVKLDCASAHANQNGYHYHGNMFEYVEQLRPGISTTDDIPDEPLQVGWASDGFPVLYRFGPDMDGNMKEMLPSFQLKKGLRPGDGISAPCGPYNGKYSADYEYICGKGDLNQCNGIEASVTLTTMQGEETFNFYYVITSEFPQIPRCMLGHFSEDFGNGNANINGDDVDGDGFIEAYDCDDENPEINPLAEEIPGNDVDENCDGIISSVDDIEQIGFTLSPNPNDGNFVVRSSSGDQFVLQLYSVAGQLIAEKSGTGAFVFTDIPSGLYLLTVSKNGVFVGTSKVAVQ